MKSSTKESAYLTGTVSLKRVVPDGELTVKKGGFEVCRRGASVLE